ncbi:NAD(+)/NADH kinase [Methanobrevibacter sp.]|uniref:NAD(+)/NADH kinase n=1 Tax=Methanobrevibacter sp. TaxID=66852 RepID=UPI0025DA9ED2|nr:NAD(+)/NADH kinase [Methanobrevibacter sp.]MBQ2666347.1 NAD(+)/NADH kinase [Methanobrevibacter sp.]MBQ2666960.1 NAD(+)/NADH kinase [Methanobrevibacter sp.]
MKAYINADDTRQIALDTKQKVIEIFKELKIEITNDINDADMIISIGGDGTFLKSARLSTGKPIVGINTGTLGYLTEISPINIKKAFTNILDGKYHIEDRIMLEGEVIKKNGDVIKIPESLNEIAISKNAFGVVRFDAIINGKLINSYTADGILVCTPTGSTAYNLSCGGPIVDPTANILTLTPIAPHTVLNRSVILSKDSTVEIKITELRENTSSYVVYDGISMEVFSGDVIRIKKSYKITKIIKLEERSFIDNIRENIN